MKVKICGITRFEDAKKAIELGADQLGFIFVPNSPRYIDPIDARAIVSKLGELVIDYVGVFVNQSAEEVEGIAAYVGLSSIQLHGDEDPKEYLGLGYPLSKAIHAPHELSREDARELAQETSFRIIIDYKEGDFTGGSGKPGEWSFAKRYQGLVPVILAGGISDQNIAKVIENYSPVGIDLSSGVEKSPGIKDFEKLENLFKEINEGVRHAI